MHMHCTVGSYLLMSLSQDNYWLCFSYSITMPEDTGSRRLMWLASMATVSEIMAWHVCHNPKMNILQSRTRNVSLARATAGTCVAFETVSRQVNVLARRLLQLALSELQQHCQPQHMHTSWHGLCSINLTQCVVICHALACPVPATE